jgi:hypothetical protein
MAASWERRAAVCTALAGALLVAAGPAAAQEAGELPAGAGTRDHLQLGLGFFDVYDQEDGAVHASAIYRPGVRVLDFGAQADDVWQGIGPQVGVGLNNEGGKLAHAGLFLDLRPFDNVVVWPGISATAWDEGDSRDLGGTFQFMSELYIGYRLPWDDLVGVSIQHISNADIHDDNPGGDIAMATYTLSFGPLFGN